MHSQRSMFALETPTVVFPKRAINLIQAPIGYSKISEGAIPTKNT